MKMHMLVLALAAGWISPGLAKDCQRLEAKVEHYEQLRRLGGSPRQMARWQEFQREHEAELQSCKSTHTPAISIVNGNSATNQSHHRDSLRSRTKPAPIEQQLLNTCNYWITENNQHPTESSQTMKDSACKALDNWSGTHPGTTHYQQPLENCIKPNNRIDDGVTACMEKKLPESTQDTAS